MNKQPDEWMEFQQLWKEQDVPDIAEIKLQLDRSTRWMSIIHFTDFIVTLVSIVFGAYLIYRATDWVGVALGITMIVAVGLLMLFMHRYRRSMWEAPQGSTRSLLEFSKERSQKNLFLLRLTPFIAIAAYPLGILSAIVLRQEPYITPFAERMVSYGVFGLAFFLVLVVFCWFFQRRFKNQIARTEALLESIDDDVA